MCNKSYRRTCLCIEWYLNMLPELKKVLNTHESFFLLNLLRWHWLIGSYRFQVYITVIYYLYKVCPVGIQPYNMENRDIYWRKYKIQETLYIGQWCLGFLQSRHLGTSHNFPNHHQLSHGIFLNLINGLKSLLIQRCC